MMETLSVRVYNVRFGDAIFITVPDKNNNGQIENRHILIDVGNILSGEGGDDTVFEPVIKDIQKLLDNKPLDLYIMTHEHLDHTQGLLYAAEKLGLKIKADYAWLTASSAPDYYETHDKAKKQRMMAEKAYHAIYNFYQLTTEEQTPWIKTLMANNNPRSTKQCIAFLRKIAKKTLYVHRESHLTGSHPFNEAQFNIWAPEEDTSIYYGRFRPITALRFSLSQKPDKELDKITPKPPPGVNAGDFYNLVNMRRYGYLDNLLMIDKAANNTSIVFSLKWRGWTFLFTGDAERRSWQTMNKYGMLEPVHFLKVSHHGSYTGMPEPELLEKILPLRVPARKKRNAVISTYPGPYKDVPDRELLASELSPRCGLAFVEKETVPDGGYIDFTFKG